MPDTTVKVFDSTHSGAPAISGTAGALISVLDACLQDGYGAVTLTSLVVASNVATGTVSGGHSFAAIGATGPVLRVAGATPSGLNGDWRVTITSSTEFTFATSGITDQTATGTITAKRAPAGFTKVYSGTNKAAYRADALASTRLYLRVDDSPAQYPTLIGYETMSNVDTGTGPMPTSSSYYTGKSSAASSAARAWRLYADDRSFYLFINANGINWPASFFFGDIVSYLSGDAYHAALIAHSSGATTSSQLYGLDSATASSLARSYTQLGGAIASRRYSHGKTSLLGYGGQAYPNPADNAFHAWPVEVWESNTLARGVLPGLWNPIHAANPADGTVISNIPQLSGRDLLVQQLVNDNHRAAFDVTGPWR